MSELKHNHAVAEVDLPPRAPAHTLLRIRLPQGKHIASSTLSIKDGETLDLSSECSHYRAVIDFK